RPGTPGSGDLAIELLPLDGSKGKVIPVPGAIQKQAGWRSSVGPWFSYLTENPLALQAINVTTGQTRTITERPAQAVSGLAGRGGLEQDGSAWLYAESDTSATADCGTWVCAASGFSIKRTDPATGETQVVRNFPREPAPPRRYGFSVHGTRLLHFVERGDSVDLVFTSGPSGSPARLASFLKGEVVSDEGPVWSWKGDRAAICGRGGADQHPLLMILTIPAATGGTMTRQDFELGTGDVCWDLTWRTEDRGLFMVGVLRKGGRQDILHLSLQSGSRPVAVTANDPDLQWGLDYLPSPDGRRVAYPVQTYRGSSTYLVDLKPLLKLPK
ncbi:MAG TPA: hypothetical protein VLL51_09655, partial [Gemmatimonadales bacterium]|nr:hypothetical protein [Gemmatimonadales bacterium]